MGATTLNTSAMERYHSYDFAWLGPIFYPLGLSLCSLGFASYFLLTYPARAESKSVPRRKEVALIEALIVALVMVEWIFSVCCLVQCVVNYSSQEYKGETSACEIQSVYVTYYMWSALLLTGSILIVASQYERQCLHVGKAMPSITLAAGTVTVIFVLALVFAFMPFVGVGNFRFAVDYCQPDLEGTGHGLAFVLVYLTLLPTCVTSIGCLWSTAVARTSVTDVESIPGAAKMGATPKDLADRDLSNDASTTEVSVKGSAKDASSDDEQETAHPLAPTVERNRFFGGLMTPGRSMHFYAVLLFVYVLTLWPTVVIYVVASDGEQVATGPWSAKRLYGVQAIFLHQGQLFHPVLYGWLLRARMYRVKVPFSK